MMREQIECFSSQNMFAKRNILNLIDFIAPVSSVGYFIWSHLDIKKKINHLWLPATQRVKIRKIIKII